MVNPSESPYAVFNRNPIWKNDVLGNDPDVVFKGTDDKELRIKAPGEDKTVNVPVPLNENKTVDLGLGNVDPDKFVYGFTAQVDGQMSFGGGGQWGGELTVANFTSEKYSGYNYVYAGVHTAASFGAQMSFSASAGASLFVGYNTDKKYDPSTFAGNSYSASFSQDLKQIVGGGYSVSGFSSTPDVKSPGWKGVSFGVNVAVGEGVNLGAIGVQTSKTVLLNTVKATAQRSWADIMLNRIAPVKSSVADYILNNVSK